MRLKRILSLFLLLGVFSSVQGDVSSYIDYPPTPIRPVSEVYHGVEVTEGYRWLENGDDPKVHEWSIAQNREAEAYLDALPETDKTREAITAIMTSEEVVYYDVVEVAGIYFAQKHQPPMQQSLLVVFNDPNHPESGRILFDPNQASEKGAIAMDWFEPSFDGRYVAISLSSGGSEAGDVHVYEVATGKPVFEVIPRVNTGTAGGDLAWMPDNSGFFYTRHPRPGEREEADLNFFQKAYFHELGTDTSEDRYELGEGFPRIAEIEFEMEPESGQVLMTVQDGDGGEFSHFLRSVNGEWRQFSSFGDGLLQATFAGPETLIALSTAEAPKGKILKIDTGPLDVTSAPVIIPEGEDTVVNSFYRDPPSILATESSLYVLFQKGGPSEIRCFDFDGNPKAGPAQESVADVNGMNALGGDDILFSVRSYTHPLYFFRYESDSGSTQKLAISSEPSVSFEDIEVSREWAVSKDGTRIPVNILLPKSVKRDGATPFVLYGYGGYGVNLTPRYRETLRVLFDHGFGYAVANIRGGGEFGEVWHEEGMLTHKQNVFDDFAAAGEFLIDEGYTDSDHLSIMGGSNGGLLMGALLTQHPQLMRAVVSSVGIYDMLRVELSPNGSFNIPEFGTVKDPEHFEALYAYSPYHRVKDEEEYPAVLMLTGANDPRVDPMQSRKMTARLQAASDSDHPILLRTSFNAGHGQGTPLSEQVEQAVLIYQFLIHELGAEG